MARDLNAKKLNFVQREVSAISRLLEAIEQLDALGIEGTRMDYANATTGITQAVLTGSDYEFVTPAQLVDAIVQYNTLRAALTPAIHTALLRLRP